VIQKFRTDNSILRRGSGRPPPPDADRECVRLAFYNSTILSVRQAPMSTVYKQARKVMKKFPYKITMIHDLKSEDYPKLYDLSIWYVCTVWKYTKVNMENMRFLTEIPVFSCSLERYIGNI
jgi:hypothetical protein